MKPETLAILKNFSHINQSIFLEAEKPYIHTKSAAGTVYAYADVEDTFPCDVPLYNLNSFLSTISLFDDPDFHFHENHVDIQEHNDRHSCTYKYSPPELIDRPSRVLTLADEDINFSFDVSRQDMQKLFKAAAAMQIKDVTVTFEDEKLAIKLFNVNNSGADSYFIEIEEYEGRPVSEKCVFTLDGFRLMDSGYKWSFAVERGIVRLSGNPVTYYVAMYE